MNDDYVTQETFNSEIKRSDEKTDTILARIEDKLDAHQNIMRLEMQMHYARTDAQLSSMNGRIDKIEARLDWLVHLIGWGIGIFGIIITVGTFVIQILLKK